MISNLLHLPGAIVANRAGTPRLPRCITFLITFRCNLRCVMCNTLTHLAKLQRKNRFHVNVSQVVLDDRGVREYFRLKRILAPLSIEVHPVIAYDADTALYPGRVLKTDLELAYQYDDAFRSRLKSFIRTVLQNGRSRDWGTGLAKRYYLEGIYNRIVRGEKRPNPRCVALSSHMRISPNGDIPVCMHNSNVVGNLVRWCFPEGQKPACEAARFRRTVDFLPVFSGPCLKTL